MKPSVTLAPLLIVGILIPFPAGATASPIADAGLSQVVQEGAPFVLEGHLEGFDGTVTVAWSAPPGCTVTQPTWILTEATCSGSGLRTFTLEASDPSSTASADVVESVVSSTHVTLLDRSGSTDAGAGGVPIVQYHYRSLNQGTMTARLEMSGLAADYDLSLVTPERTNVVAEESPDVETVSIPDAPAGSWMAQIQPFTVAQGRYHLSVTLDTQFGLRELPSIQVPSIIASVGREVTLEARVTGAEAPYVVRWESDPTSRAFDDGTGGTLVVTALHDLVYRVRVTDARGLTAETTAKVGTVHPRPVTIVAVVDGSFTPYHYDFIGSQHPWTLDHTGFDFSADPATYVPGYPGATPLLLTLPTSPSDDIEATATGPDAAVWASMKASSPTQGINLYRFPGTKVIGALHFGGGFLGTGGAHGTRSAASAVGNIHGTCPECLVVLIQDGPNNEGLRWAAAQPWIDVVTNSYGHGSPVQSATLGLTRDNAYWKGPVEETRAASEDGQVIVFSAGNGLLNAFDVPMHTYASSEKGPDWMITVGAVEASQARQTYSGAGKPVDVSSIGDNYPSTGGTTAAGTGTHSGTSNAAPTTAGTIAHALQSARDALGDLTPGHDAGVVAAGEPVVCGPAVPACALGDGILTRRELEDSVLANVLPSRRAESVDTVWPSTEYTYYYQGHGVIRGRIDGDAAYIAESTQIADHLRGIVDHPERPQGETMWFRVDSKCRQHFWGEWNGGLWHGETLSPDIKDDPLARAYDEACSRTPDRPFGSLAPIIP